MRGANFGWLAAATALLVVLANGATPRAASKATHLISRRLYEALFIS